MKFIKKFNLCKISNNKKKKLYINKNIYNSFINLNTFVNFIFKSGNKKFIKNCVLKSFNYFFLLFKKNDIIIQNIKSQVNILKQSFFKDFNNFNINFLLNNIFNLLNPIFDVVCYSVPKKYKKKIKKNYFFKIKYNYYNSRKKISYK